jgi:TRAP-type C4-dicarboxylate transport system substrate-binding protein
MRKFRDCLLFVFVLTAVGMTVSLGYGATRTVYKARLSYHFSGTHLSATSTEKFVKMVREETDGQVDITTYPAAALYSIRDIVGALGKGAVEFGNIINSSLPAIDPSFSIDSIWYICEPGHTRRLWTETDAGKRTWMDMERKCNFKRVVWLPNGPTGIFTTGKIVKKLEDFYGMDIRYLAKSEVPTYKALQMKYVSVSTEEMHTALERKMINGLMTSPTALKAYSWWDYAKHTTLPYPYYMEAFIGVNMDWWNRLPEDLQRKILKVGEIVSAEHTRKVQSDSEECLGEMVKLKGGSMYTMPKEEVDRIREHLFKNGAYAEIQNVVKPDLWEALLNVTGVKLRK